MKIRYAVFLGMMMVSQPVLAQNPLSGSQNSSKPLEITASQTLEWHRNDKQYIARGDVVARQGDVSIEAALLTADYRESEKSNMDIYRLTAEQNVRIVSQGSTAEGDKAVYEVDKGLATMTGNALKLYSPGQSVTARDRFEYWVTEGRLNAVGQARAIKGEDTIDAQTLSAVFVDDPAAHTRKLSKLEASGGVVITTPTETLQGDQGTYDASTTVATITGHVVIKRGPNILEGDSADVNLTTNVSRMHGGTAGGGGRVRGVFYPGSQDGAASKSSPQQTVPQKKTMQLHMPVR